MEVLSKHLLSQVSGAKALSQDRIVWHKSSQVIRPADKGYTQPVPFPTFTR